MVPRRSPVPLLSHLANRVSPLVEGARHRRVRAGQVDVQMRRRAAGAAADHQHGIANPALGVHDPAAIMDRA